MKHFLLLSLFVSLPLSTFSAPLDITPGLWKTEVKFELNSEQKTMLEQMKGLLSSLPKEQQDQIKGFLNGEKKVSNECITKEMIEDPAKLKFDEGQDCKNKIKTSTSTKLVMDIECKDGTKGEISLNIKSKKEMEATGKAKSAFGEMKFSQKGTFIKADCK